MAAVANASASDLPWSVLKMVEMNGSAGGGGRVPNCFIRPVEEAASHSTSLDLRVPVVDMNTFKGSTKTQALQQLASACESWGFFQLSNHGVPNHLIQQTLQLSRQFFELPFEEKQKYVIDPDCNTDGYGRVNIKSSENDLLDWGDSFVAEYSPASSRNFDKWPMEPAAFRKVVSAYCDEIEKLSHELFSLFEEALGLPPAYIREVCGEHGLQFGINYYPSCPQPDLVLGLSAHSDNVPIITILIQDEAGLQVRKDGKWVQVDAIPNHIVVNIADQLEVISNGRFKSVVHRVAVNSLKSRLSFSIFYKPEIGAQIAPAPQLLDELHPALYEERTFSGVSPYAQTRLQEQESLEKIRLSSRK
uniref:Fe(II)/2-oxoglutarate-dependent dioxygenase 3 n=1 Tax=Phlegmariurus tetrastichus TaxID=1263146 RepID=A0A8F1SZL1_9TRAC|nr:Fe(II)/2-oxoglutarate-dependent dioxygenase 3 [Phlegmariurus tetrastichus]